MGNGLLPPGAFNQPRRRKEDKQNKKLGIVAKEIRRDLERDLSELQNKAEKISTTITMLTELETNVGSAVNGGSAPKQKTRKTRSRRKTDGPSYTELLDRLRDKGKPFTRRDYAVFVGKHISKPSDGAMAQAIANRISLKKLKAAGQAKPIKIGTRMVKLKLYKAA